MSYCLQITGTTCQPSRNLQQQPCIPPLRAPSQAGHTTASSGSPCPRLIHYTTARAASAGDSSTGPSSSDSNSTGPLSVLQKWQRDSKQMQEQLKALGAAGVIAYGLFNTLYYTVAFVFVWFSIANVPSGLGFSAAARKAAEVFALIWAGSQVTKLLRAGAALACAPLIDKGLDRLGLHDKRKAYLFIVMGCVVLASAVMGVVIALHA